MKKKGEKVYFASLFVCFVKCSVTVNQRQSIYILLCCLQGKNGQHSSEFLSLFYFFLLHISFHATFSAACTLLVSPRAQSTDCFSAHTPRFIASRQSTSLSLSPARLLSSLSPSPPLTRTLRPKAWPLFIKGHCNNKLM